MTYKEPKVEEYWLCLGDIHVGSEVAPMPPRAEVELLNGDTRVITPNAVQRKFNGAWNHMVENLPKLMGVVLNGDLCDGPNRKNGGRGIWTTDLRAQVGACIELLKPIKARMTHPKNWYGTLGSEYHTVDDRPLDQAVCEGLGGHHQAEQIIPMMKGEFRVHAHHVISGSLGNWTYLPTAPARDHMLIALQNDKLEYGDIDWVLRSHRHQYTSVRFGAHQGVTILPGWQGKTEFVVRKGGVAVPKIGYCLLKLYDDGTANMTPYLTRVIAPCKDAPVAYDGSEVKP
jgi:hypothetical protein